MPTPNGPFIVQLLSANAVFQSLPLEFLSSLANEFEAVTLQHGESLVTEGQIHDLFGFVVEGKLHSVKCGKEARSLGSGQSFGLHHLFSEKLSSSTYVALKEPCSLYILRRKKFMAMIQNHPDISLHLMSALANMINEATPSNMDLDDVSANSSMDALSMQVKKNLKVRLFDVKPYQVEGFVEQNKHFNFELEFIKDKLSADTVHLAYGSDVVCVFVHDHIDEKVAKALKDNGVGLVAFRCAGFDACDVKACDINELSVVRVPGYSPNAIAEHACALMLALNRKIVIANAKVHSGDFSLDGLVGFDMKGKVVGVIGTGKIGACLVHIMLGFGCRVICYDLYENPSLVANPLVRYVSLDELLSTSDIISIHAPLLEKTFHMINADALAKMKRGVMIINTSRGPLVDTNALIEALKSGQVSSCGLDVVEGENDYFYENKSNEIMTNDNIARLLAFSGHVIITAHQAYLTQEALREIAYVTLNNIKEFQSGKRMKALTNSVNNL